MNPRGQFFMTQRGQFRMAFDRAAMQLSDVVLPGARDQAFEFLNCNSTAGANSRLKPSEKTSPLPVVACPVTRHYCGERRLSSRFVYWLGNVARLRESWRHNRSVLHGHVGSRSVRMRARFRSRASAPMTTASFQITEAFAQVERESRMRT